MTIGHEYRWLNTSEMAVSTYSDHDDLHTETERVPLTDLEVGGSMTQESGRLEGSLDLSEDDVDHGLLSGRSNRDPYTTDLKQSSSNRFEWVSIFLRGPLSPHNHRINPFFEHFQTAPLRLIRRIFPSVKSQIAVLLAFHLLWVLIFLTILNWSVVKSEIPGHGMPHRLSCGARIWYNGTLCGVNGDACRPFDDQAFAFRCPAGCLDTVLLEPYTVGDQELNYNPLVIGGALGAEDSTAYYRGDSFVCSAAIHAGIVNNAAGGCGILRRTGEKSEFKAVQQNGISSVAFNSYFPLSYTFEKDASAICRDPRWLLFVISVICTSVVSLFTTSPAVFYVSVWFISWFQVALASDPPFYPDYLEVVSTGVGRLLPAAFVGWAIYYFCVQETLRGLNSQYEKTVLWLGPFWVGALNNDTFDRIPISRLTPHDIQQQPGALPALITIVSIIVVAMVSQVWAFWAAGKLPRYLIIYGSMASALIIMIALPQLNLRIHHYILALLLLPGTALQTRPCLVYQGLLVGLFINGIARWGFDSILQTPAALLGDAHLGSALPSITASAIDVAGNNLTFLISAIPVDVFGIAVLVNDVLRTHIYRNTSSPTSNALEEAQEATDSLFHWTRLRQNQSEYFRFAYIKTSALGGLWYEDFTKAGVWKEDGDWIDIPSGPSL